MHLGNALSMLVCWKAKIIHVLEVLNALEIFILNEASILVELLLFLLPSLLFRFRTGH